MKAKGKEKLKMEEDRLTKGYLSCEGDQKAK